MLEVGAFHPSWGDIHLGPENALKAHALLGGGALLPVHWGTFNLALHAWDEPAETLAALARSSGWRCYTPRLGQPRGAERATPLGPWWRRPARPEAGGGALFLFFTFVRNLTPPSGFEGPFQEAFT